jgi:uncharacterized protein (TIGR02996 family)
VTDRDTLLSTVLANPADYTARLVLADLLRESDDPDEQARGRFLWAGVTAAGFRDHELIDDPLYYSAQEEINAVAVAGYPALWLSALGLGPQPLTVGNWAWDCTLDRVTVRMGATVGTFSRGMLSELTVTLGEWYDIAPAALLAWPVEAVSVSDVPGLTIRAEPPGDERTEWRLSGSLTLQLPRPAGRRRNPLLRLNEAMFGPEGEVEPAPSSRWSAEREFSERGKLVADIVRMSEAVVDAIRSQSAGLWPTPGRR